MFFFIVGSRMGSRANYIIFILITKCVVVGMLKFILHNMWELSVIKMRLKKFENT